MKQIRIASAVLFLLFATFACAQEPREEPQPQQQEKPKARPDKEVPLDKEAKPSKQDESKPAKQEKQEKADTKKNEQLQQGHSRPAGKSAHIPDEKFRSSFGRQHTFAIRHPEIVGGQPRFQYGGYWFEIIDPWPVEWAYTDDCYIDFIDGEYFIFDVLHPGVRIAVFVVL